MEVTSQVIQALNASFEKARVEKLKKVVLLTKCFDKNQLFWFLNFNKVFRSTFNLLFATPCSLRFNRHTKVFFEIFFDENKITSVIPDDIFDSFAQQTNSW